MVPGTRDVRASFTRDFTLGMRFFSQILRRRDCGGTSDCSPLDEPMIRGHCQNCTIALAGMLPGPLRWSNLGKRVCHGDVFCFVWIE